MKKIININLSGRVIPIEDTAYEKLQAYIESLRRYFAHEEGRDEIINDIESRIAELLHENIRKGATVITDTDVDSIVASMGRPEDFDAETLESEKTQQQGQQQSQQQYTYGTKRPRGRLYRDSSDKFIAGVCSGLASYLNVDPAIVRILFAIITFGGFGFGVLAYILLWIFLPEKDIEGYSGKRLYRNPDDKVIGGVAGGLAAYFNRSSSTIRIIFAFPLILNIIFGVLNGIFNSYEHDFFFFPNVFFGSFTGTFILVYIVLWIVLPVANSPYEKMEMRGEKVDVNTIRQNVKDGVENMKERMKTWSDEVKDSAQQFSSRAREFSNTKGKTFAREFSETARTGGRGIGHAIGVLFKVFFLFIAGSIAIALFCMFLFLLFGGIAWWPVNDFLWTSNVQQLYAWGTLIFFLLVPLIAFITWVIRRIIRVRSRNSYLGWTFGFLWTIGWIAAILLVSSVIRDFRVREHARDIPVAISQPANGKMIVMVSQPPLEYNGRYGWMNDDWEGWDISDDTLRLSTIGFRFDKSVDSNYHVTIRKYSMGSSDEDAIARAEKIQYSVSYMDSVLDLSNGYAIDKGSKFRGQQVEVEILIPVGKRIRFDESVNDKLNPTDVKIKRRVRRNGGVTVEINDDYWRQFRPGVDYIMGADGLLKDSEGRLPSYDDYRYEEHDSIRTRKAIEQKEREIQELKDKQRLIEKRDTTSRTFNNEPESIDAKDDGTVAATSWSIISFVNWF
ncbi:MAG TPA: PspC domain-containing protein [Chitinophagaceae bacterium]